MGTKCFMAVGVFSVELLAYQVSMVCAANWPRSRSRGGEGRGLPYETDRDARRLAKECKFWILVSHRVFREKSQYFMPPRSRFGFREETRNYAKRNTFS